MSNDLRQEVHADFLDAIIQKSLAHSSFQEHPVAIITVGETGAGRSVLAMQAQDELSHRGGSVLIDNDHFKVFHPGYVDSLKTNDAQAAKDAESTAYVITNSVFRKAVDGRHNLVINELPGQADLKSLTENLHDNGYEVELRAIATPSARSTMRYHFQYEEEKLHLGFGQVKDWMNQEEEVATVHHAIDHAEHENLVDRIKVYDRVGNEVYNNELNPDKQTWFKEPEAIKAFDFERSKPMGRSENEYNQMLWQRLVELKLARNAPESEVNHARLELNHLSELGQRVKESDLKIEKDGRDNGLIIKEARLFNGIQQGLLVNKTDHHLLVQVSPMVAIKYDRDRMLYNANGSDDELEVGQQLNINHGTHHFELVHSQQLDQLMQQQEVMQQQEHERGFER